MATLGRSPGAAPLTSVDIPDNSITAAKIVEGTITVGDIGTDAVGTDELANDVVISTSGAITTTGAFTSVGIDDNASGATAIYIDADEKVGIGVSDPHTELEVNGSISCGSDQATPVAALYVRTSHATEYAAHIENTHTEKGHGLHVASNADEDDEYILKCTNGASATVLCATGAGNVGIGTTAPGTPLQVTHSLDHSGGDFYTNLKGAIFLQNTSSTGRTVLKFENDNVTYPATIVFGDYFQIYGRTATATRLSIDASGNFAGSASSDISDERLKENISSISGALATINNVEGRTFTWKPEAKMPTGTQYGIIAQELDSVVPDLVFNESGIRIFNKDNELKEIKDLETDEYAKSVRMTGLIPVLVEAVKELSAKVTALEAV